MLSDFYFPAFERHESNCRCISGVLPNDPNMLRSGWITANQLAAKIQRYEADNSLTIQIVVERHYRTDASPIGPYRLTTGTTSLAAAYSLVAGVTLDNKAWWYGFRIEDREFSLACTAHLAVLCGQDAFARGLELPTVFPTRGSCLPVETGDGRTAMMMNG